MVAVLDQLTFMKISQTGKGWQPVPPVSTSN